MTYQFRSRKEPFEFYSEFDDTEVSLTNDFAETWQGEVSPEDFDRYILWVQQSLNKILKLRLKENGLIGSDTRSAIRSLHNKLGLGKPSDGVICPATEQALIAAGATPPPGMVEARGPETTPPRRTIYLDIPLQIPLGKAKSMTGIFIPESYCPLSQVDLIVYLHGWKVRDHKPEYSIDTYWSLPIFRLREEVNKSQKNVILVAPTLGPKNEPGSLTCPGGFDRFLGQVMMALKQYGPYVGMKTTLSIGNIILACHSGSWKVMEAIAKSTNTYVTQIREYWAFDPESMSNMWKNWAQSHSTDNLYIYYGSGRAGQLLCRQLMGKNMPKSGQVSCKKNVLGEIATVKHDAIPRVYLKDRIQGAQFLVDKLNCPSSGTRQSISSIRHIFRSQEIPFDLSNESGRVELWNNNPWAEDVWQEEMPRNSPDYIRWVQQSLNQIMGLGLAVDGDLGPQTRSAIRSFQQRQGLKADGIVGEKTQAAIKAASTPGTPAKKASFPYVRDFSGPATECTDALKRAGKTRAEALTIINAQIGVAIAMLRKAANDLKRGSRSSKTRDLFLKIFRVRPEFVPTWLQTTATIKDRGDVVATRCKRVAALLASGKIKFFCTINSTNCLDCSNNPNRFACSSYGDHNVVCLGNAFWDAMKAGDTDSLLATLMHEPFHIYYGLYVTEHPGRGKFGGIYCIQQFVFETNAHVAPNWVNSWCADTVVRVDGEVGAWRIQARKTPPMQSMEPRAMGGLDKIIFGHDMVGVGKNKNHNWVQAKAAAANSWIPVGGPSLQMQSEVSGLRAQVRALQVSINKWRAVSSQTPIQEDGVLGVETKKAVLEFQRASSLKKEDGIAGPATRERLTLLLNILKNIPTSVIFDVDRRSLVGLVGSTGFRSLEEPTQTEVLKRILSYQRPGTLDNIRHLTDLVTQTGFELLPTSSQKLMLLTLAARPGDAELTHTLSDLASSRGFRSLEGPSQTLVLKRIKSYGGNRVRIDNLEDLITVPIRFDQLSKESQNVMLAALAQRPNDRQLVDNFNRVADHIDSLGRNQFSALNQPIQTDALSHIVAYPRDPRNVDNLMRLVVETPDFNNLAFDIRDQILTRLPVRYENVSLNPGITANLMNLVTARGFEKIQRHVRALMLDFQANRPENAQLASAFRALVESNKFWQNLRIAPQMIQQVNDSIP